MAHSATAQTEKLGVKRGPCKYSEVCLRRCPFDCCEGHIFLLRDILGTRYPDENVSILL